MNKSFQSSATLEFDISKLLSIKEENNYVATALSDYINYSPCAISPSLIREADPDKSLPKETLYAALLAGLCNFREEDTESTSYLRKGVKRLDTSIFKNNSYYKSIKFPEKSLGGWRLTHSSYKPYEAFIRDDLLLEQDLREIPQIGFFEDRFAFPSVQQNGREWMAIKPSEILSMQPSLDLVSGKVVTFGLGLGYFPFMASMKPSVSEITIIEIAPTAISLFEKFILPQFPHKEKIHIINADAFEYMEHDMPSQNFDYAFVDLWHDNSDGLEMFLRATKLEKYSGNTVFLYWIEKFLLSAFRWKEYDHILADSSDYDDAVRNLSEEGLKVRIYKD
jgi:hypothetical protein